MLSSTPTPSGTPTALKALARLVLSYELRELADRAAVGVSTGSDDYAEPGEEVGDALALVHQAQGGP
ncbi:hypothetical protein LT493_42385 [Streptomyces tricolor]|nr:hypothetical protein [Streptomyces tricolor]